MDGADTTTMTTSGTTITQMRDKSGNGYNSTAIGGAPALTANAINGLPAISFNGSSYITGCNANTNTTTNTNTNENTNTNTNTSTNTNTNTT
jgi:hypothetical protein